MNLEESIITITVEEFLEFVYPNNETPILVGIDASGERAKTYSVEARTLNRSKKILAHGLYFAKSSGLAPRSWRASNFNAYHVLVLDDIGTKVSAPDFEPSYVIESSKGNYQYGYVLDEPITDYDYAVRFDAAFYEKELNLSDTGVKGVMHLVRMPFGINDKPGKDDFKVVCRHWSGLVFSPDELLEAFNAEVSTHTVHRVTKPMDATGDYSDDAVYQWLVEQGLVVGDNGRFIDVPCPWAHTHTSGDNLAGFSPIHHGDYPHARAFSCFHEHCYSKKIAEYLDWVKEQGGPDLGANQIYEPNDLLKMMIKDYCVIVDGRRVGNLCNDRNVAMPIMKREEFKDKFRQKNEIKGKQYLVADMFLNHEDTTIVRDSRYVPSHDRLIIMDGEQFYNHFQFPNQKETTREPTTFLDHLDFLIPSDVEREYFLDWLAAHVQTPGKCLPAVVIVGAHGTGKSWVADMLHYVLGDANVGAAPYSVFLPSQNRSQYDDWMVNKQLIVMEEVYDPGTEYRERMEAYERSKQICGTSPFKASINEKGGKQYSTMIYANVLMFSNHDDALILPVVDRRHNVFKATHEQPSDEYKEKIWDHCYRDEDQRNDEASAIYRFLEARTITHNLIKPIETPARTQMMQLNQSPIDEIFDVAVESLPGDVCTKFQMLQVCKHRIAPSLDYEWQSYFSAVIGKHFEKLPALDPANPRKRIYVGDKERAIVRILGDEEHWRACSGEAIAKEVKLNGPYRDGLGVGLETVHNLALRSVKG